MKRVSMFVAALALTALLGTFGAASAQANNVSNDITAVGGTNFFGAIHSDSDDFTDTFTFNIADAVSASVSLITIASNSGQNNIDFVSAFLNGVALTLTPNGKIESGFLEETTFTGPLVLTVTGRTNAAGGAFASYSGTMNVAIVPEPSTALMMGLGLGGLGLAARRARA